MLGHELFIASITGVEVLLAIARRAKGGGLSGPDAATATADFRYDFAVHYQVIGVSDDLIISAMILA